MATPQHGIQQDKEQQQQKKATPSLGSQPTPQRDKTTEENRPTPQQGETREKKLTEATPGEQPIPVPKHRSARPKEKGRTMDSDQDETPDGQPTPEHRSARPKKKQQDEKREKTIAIAEATPSGQAVPIPESKSARPEKKEKKGDRDNEAPPGGQPVPEHRSARPKEEQEQEKQEEHGRRPTPHRPTRLNRAKSTTTPLSCSGNSTAIPYLSGTGGGSTAEESSSEATLGGQPDEEEETRQERKEQEKHGLRPALRRSTRLNCAECTAASPYLPGADGGTHARESEDEATLGGRPKGKEGEKQENKKQEQDHQPALHRSSRLRRTGCTTASPYLPGADGGTQAREGGGKTTLGRRLDEGGKQEKEKQEEHGRRPTSRHRSTQSLEGEEQR